MEDKFFEEKIAIIKLRGERAEQQDIHASRESIIKGIKRSVYAVADGRGPKGEKAAAFAVKAAVNDLSAEPRLDAPAIREQFLLIHDAVSKLADKSGTTLSVAIVEDHKLTTAFVGDSEVWILKDGELRRRTAPHRYGEHKKETARLERTAANIRGGYLIANISSPNVSDEAPAKIKLTRALGNEEFDPYLSHEPEIETVKLTGGEKFLLIGTNGFWDAATLNSKSHHAVEHALVASETAEEARKKISSILSRRNIPDNATVMIIKL
ncbi:MAG: PP2C family serine/threonine-protein phosphatase [bacterium]